MSKKVIDYFFSGSNDQLDLLIKKFGEPTCSLTTNGFEKNELSQHLVRTNKIHLGDFDVNWDEIPAVSKEILDKFANIELTYLKMADRLGYLLSYQERKYAYNRTLRFWLSFFNLHKVHKAIFINIPHQGYDYIAMEVLNFLKVKLLMFNQMPIIPGKSYTIFTINDTDDHSKFLRNEYKIIKANKNKKLNCKKSVSAFKLFSPNSNTKSFTRANISLKKKQPFFDIRILISKYFLNKQSWSIDKVKKALFVQSYYTGICLDPFFSTPNKIIAYYNSLSNSPKLNDKYVYFALHFQPEQSTSPLGGHFVDQILAIDILANACKKLGLKVYVKDHPRVVNRTESRSKTFYNRLISHKNVKLIDINFDSKKLIDASICVASITGTVNFEAIFRRKHSISFGNRFYNAFDMVSLVTSEEEAVDAIKFAMSDKALISDDDINNCLYALDKFVIDAFFIEGDDDIATVSKTESNKNIVQSIENFLISKEH